MQRAMLFLTLFGLLPTSCTISNHQLPNHLMDHPVILPEGMSRHSFSYSPTIHDSDSDGIIASSIAAGLIPSFGLAKNWEMPWVIVPYFRVLIDETGTLESMNPEFHVISFFCAIGTFKTITTRNRHSMLKLLLPNCACAIKKS